MSLAEDDRLVRVVAAAVQSLVERSPNRDVNFDEAHERISMMRVYRFAGLTSALQIVFRNALRPMMRTDVLARPPTLIFKQVGWPWYRHDARDPVHFNFSKSISQKEAELTAASVFTFPYPVQRVSDRSLEVARQIIERSL